MDGELQVLTFAASLVAIVISVYALTFHRRLEHETSAQTLIHDQYELCRALDVLRAERPEVSHMLALPKPGASDPRETWENYNRFKAEVRRVFEDNGRITESDRARMYLQEHATALHVCDIYEQTLLQRDLALKARDNHRFRVLDDLAKYYEERMLRSPRLRFHWDHGASDMMEESTRARYKERVQDAYPDDPIDERSPLDD